MIKHCFDTFPKVRTSEFAMLETQLTDDKKHEHELEITHAEDITDHEAFGGEAEPQNQEGIIITDESETF